MNRLPWICARLKNVFEMSGKTNGPASAGQTPWRSDRRRHAQSTHVCKRRALTSSRSEALCGVSGVAEELRKGDQLFIERDKELAELSSQSAELQTLFDEVSHQLYTECKRIQGGDRERMRQAKQGTRCRPSQARGVPSDVVTDARHTSVVRGSGQHSKEKLQSLTSQMLLTRQSLAVTQALAQGVDTLLNGKCDKTLSEMTCMLIEVGWKKASRLVSSS